MASSRTWPPGTKSVVVMLATVVLYVLTARLGLALALPPEKKATAVWLPSGLALAAVLMAGPRVWPGIWLGAFIANAWDVFNPASRVTPVTDFLVAGGIAVGSTLQPLLAAAGLRRWVGENGIFGGARSVFKFAAITLVACLVASTIGVLTLVAGGLTPGPNIGSVWWTWWIGDAIGILIVTPLILSWAEPRWFTWSPGRTAEALLLLALLIGVAWTVFDPWRTWKTVAGQLIYLALPLLVWASFRFGQRGATTSVLLVSKIAVWGTINHQGPFVEATLNESLLLLQSFVGVLAVTTLALAGVLTERREAEQARNDAIQQLERALQEIRTLRGLIPICAWCKKIRNDAGAWEQLEAYLRQRTQAEFSHGICPDCLVTRHGLSPDSPGAPFHGSP